jgi:hypothetical protein
MDLFTATVAASADSWTFRDRATRHLSAKDDRELITADYLDNAVSPMPWPVRAAPRAADPQRSPPSAGSPKDGLIKVGRRSSRWRCRQRHRDR